MAECSVDAVYDAVSPPNSKDTRLLVSGIVITLQANVGKYIPQDKIDFWKRIKVQQWYVYFTYISIFLIDVDTVTKTV